MTDKKDKKPELESTDEKLEKRRKALKNILAGSGTVVTAAAMQDKWVKPVIESVILPAHAQASVLTAGFVANNVIVEREQNDVLDTLVPAAHAAPASKDVCINVSGSSAAVQVTVSGSAIVYTGNFTLPFGQSNLTPQDARLVNISGTLAVDGNSVGGVVSADSTPASYTAPKSSASCQLTAPTTIPPTTVAPTTIPPTTVAPTTIPPTTVAPTTIPPTTVAPTTQPPPTTPPFTTQAA